MARRYSLSLHRADWPEWWQTGDPLLLKQCLSSSEAISQLLLAAQAVVDDAKTGDERVALRRELVSVLGVALRRLHDEEEAWLARLDRER